MDALGVPPDLLPELVRSGTVIGAVSRAAAAATAIPPGTPVIAGMTDGCAAQLGAGALRPGCWNSVLGTTLVVKGVTRELIHDPLGAVYSHRAPNGDWLPGGASSCGAGLISRDFAGRDLDELGRAASAHEPAAMLAYPLGLGGRAVPVRRAGGAGVRDRRATAPRRTGSRPCCRASATSSGSASTTCISWAPR